MPGKPLYPDILRDDHWQRHKGIIAKVVKGETGVGAALTKLKQMFDKEDDWNDLAGDNAMSGKKDGQDVKEHVEQVEKAFKRLKANII